MDILLEVLLLQYLLYFIREYYDCAVGFSINEQF